MRRRTFIRAAGTVGTVGVLAGCTGGRDGPPPRKSEVVQKVNVESGQTVIDIESDVRVQSRADVVSSDQTANDDGTTPADIGAALLSLYHDAGLIGVAAAKGRGAGKGGRGAAASVPTGKNGRAKWRGAAYGAWWDNHEDEVNWYAAVPAVVAVAYLAPVGADEQRLPGPGPVEWNKRWVNQSAPGQSTSEAETSTNATASSTAAPTTVETEPVDAIAGADLKYDFKRTGWYRTGTHLIHPSGDHDFGWEAVDYQIVRRDGGGYEVKHQWKVSPKL